jgi:hypothetical protein
MEEQRQMQLQMELEKKLVVTTSTRKTCQLINLIATCKGIDVSEDLEMLLCTGADCSAQFPQSYENGTDCDNDTYDDFIINENYVFRNQGQYMHYPITWALLHHCHENTLAVIYKYTLLHSQKDAILEKLHRYIVGQYRELYKHPYFIARSNIEGTYHHKLKQKVDTYLELLELTPSIFDSAQPEVKK